jgi:hypothetical protein
MQKLLQTAAAIVMVFFCSTAFSQTARPFAIADFKTATWEVNNNGDVYSFIASNPKGAVTTDFEFDWAMTTGNDMNGHIKITAAAMKSAIAQNNHFGPSLKNAVFADKTTIWISQDIYTQLSKKGTAKMDVGEGPEIFTVVMDKDGDAEKESFKDVIKVKGSEKTVTTFHVKNSDGSRQLWILNSPQNPVIIKMDLGWTIVLRSVE